MYQTLYRVTLTTIQPDGRQQKHNLDAYSEDRAAELAKAFMDAVQREHPEVQCSVQLDTCEWTLNTIFSKKNQELLCQ